jgi:hypothetical protein
MMVFNSFAFLIFFASSCSLVTKFLLPKRQAFRVIQSWDELLFPVGTEYHDSDIWDSNVREAVLSLTHSPKRKGQAVPWEG